MKYIFIASLCAGSIFTACNTHPTDQKLMIDTIEIDNTRVDSSLVDTIAVDTAIADTITGDTF